MTSLLTSVQRYAAGTLFAIALNQAQIHQTSPLGYNGCEDAARTSNSDSVADDPDLWVHQIFALLRPIFRSLEIEHIAWPGIEETASSSPCHYHVGAFMRLFSEETNDSLTMAKESALAKAIDALAESMKTTPSSYKAKKEMHREYEHECREKFSVAGSHSDYEGTSPEIESNETNSSDFKRKESRYEVGTIGYGEPIEVETNISYPKKVVVLFELLSACLAESHGDNTKHARQRKGFDARHRVALRILATWLDVKWKKVEAMETMVACSAFYVADNEQQKEDETKSHKDTWVKWKRGGIVGAAALTGGALMAITGGLAAPAIAAGFSALAPTLGTLVPVIGASGFAAAASAAGTVAGSVAVAASLGAAGAGLTGTKMARRIGGVEEFEFKAIGENHKQGRLAVEILVSGFVFEEEDFVRPWEGKHDNLERYALQWESKNLVAVSTAIRDWFTSKIATELMKQGAMMTVLSTLVTALAWPATLLAATDFIDSRWTIALDRSDKSGKLLAEVLLKGLQGYRPVTLVGFSLGARVIFKCLQCLSENEQSSGIVERVILLGAPISIKDENWESARKAVAGRFVNVYTPNDWTLGVAFRASLLTQGLAGIQQIDVPGIENVDVTELIEGHSSYLWVTQEILEMLELDTYYPVFRSRSSS